MLEQHSKNLIRDTEMKNLIKKTFLGVVASGIMATSAVAAEKIAIVNIEYIYSKLPQIAVVQQTLQAEFAVESEKVKKLQADIRYNQDKLQREQATMSAEQTDALKADITRMYKEYEALAKPLEANMRRRSQEEQNRILGLIRQTVDSIAAAEGYDLVLSSGAVIYSGDTKDISDDIAAKVSKIK